MQGKREENEEKKKTAANELTIYHTSLRPGKREGRKVGFDATGEEIGRVNKTKRMRNRTKWRT
jgi:hypothetical protein